MARKATRKGTWGIVYVCQASSSKQIKIGCVEKLDIDAVHKRIKQFNASHPGDSQVVLKSCMRVFGDVKKVESAIHKMFADRRSTKREWFEVPPEKVEELFHIAAEYCSVADPDNRKTRAIHVVEDLKNRAEALTLRGREKKLPGFCQKCGKMAKTRKDGSFQRLCPKCAEAEAAESAERRQRKAGGSKSSSDQDNSEE